MDLKNAWVVLTGASRGIGVTIAEEFAKKGANLVLVARSMEGLEKTCTRVKQLGGTAVPIAFDLQNISEIKNLVEEIKKTTSQGLVRAPFQNKDFFAAPGQLPGYGRPSRATTDNNGII